MEGVDAQPRALAALNDVAGAGASVVLLGLDAVGDDAWGVLTASGLGVVHVAGERGAIRELKQQVAQVVLVDVQRAPALIRAVRAERGSRARTSSSARREAIGCAPRSTPAPTT